MKKFKLIFSAHGLPEKNIKKGDPYQWQIEQSVNEIVKSLNIKDEKISLYVGSGITKDSCPDNEWVEILKKSETMLNAIF